MIALPWPEIDSVLLDMDGTVLDRHFDDHFWEEHVPMRFAARHGLALDDAKHRLYAEYKAREGTLNWTDIDFWSARLGLDIPALKEEMADRVRVHPGVTSFLTFLRGERKHVALVTNAHPKTVAIKLKRTPLPAYFDVVVCSADIGAPKEEAAFWNAARARLGFDKRRTLFIDDTEAVLCAAEAFGIRFLLYKADANSQIASNGSGRFQALRHFEDIIPPIACQSNGPPYDSRRD